MARHTHDQKGNRTGPFEMRIGSEIMTYYKVHCTCGALVTNDITERRPA